MSSRITQLQSPTRDWLRYPTETLDTYNLWTHRLNMDAKLVELKLRLAALKDEAEKIKSKKDKESKDIDEHA